MIRGRRPGRSGAGRRAIDWPGRSGVRGVSRARAGGPGEAMVQGRGTGGRGAGRWVRRRALPWAARLLALLALGAVGAYAAGRVLTDSGHWSQYLWWTPALWTLGAAWTLLGLSALAGRAALHPGGVMLRPLALAACVAASLWLTLGEWNLHRAVVGPRPAARAGTLRVLHWNQAAAMAPGGAELIRASDPDLAIVVNPRFDRFRREVVAAMGGLAPGGSEVRLDGRVTASTEPGHFFSTGMTLVGSRERILRAGLVSLSPVAGHDASWRTARDPGFVLWLEIEAGERFAALGRPVVVWVVDLPSDPSVWRGAVMANAARAVAAWEAPAMVCDEAGRWRSGGEPVRAPAPDLVIGDFNTLRGSASLEVFVPGMEDAFARAGWGRARSWTPRATRRAERALLALADWHIDLALYGGSWRAARYRLLGTPGGLHKAQVVDLAPR